MASVSPRLCEICLALGLTRADFENPPFMPTERRYSIVLSGTIGGLRSREKECGLCRLLLHALSRNLKDQPDLLSKWDAEWEAEWLQNSLEYDSVAEGAEDACGSALYPRLKGTSVSSTYGVQLVDDAATTKPLRARRMAADLDMMVVKSWVKRCRDEHGPQCADTYLIVAENPIDVPGFFVIDVLRKRLTPLPPCAEYIALSYVWGRTNFVTTTLSNADLFRSDGAFDRVKLPATIQDAMDVTMDLGYRFLWVDALCIVQDDQKTKPRLIANMDAVYGNAALTIVAASGTHAAAGFLRNGNCEDNELGLVAEDILPGFSLAVVPFLDGELMDCAHAQRGWTYQEGCLSARCLVFLEGHVYFVCRASVWRKDVMAETSAFRPFDGANILGKTASEWPLRRYAEHVQAFTSRQLTYEPDVLNAFAGVQKAMAKSMNGTKMWQGLPAAAFDWAILWRPPHGTVLRRRPGFPSWSWTGWTGAVSMAVDSYSVFDQNWLRERTWIEWYIADSDGSLIPIWDEKIDETAQTGLRLNAHNPAKDAPKAISHESFDDTSDAASALEDDCDDYFMPQYRELSMGDGSRRKFARKLAAKLCNDRRDAPVHDDPVRNRGDGPTRAGTLCFYSFFTMMFLFRLEHTDNGLEKILANNGQLLGFLRADSGERFTKDSILGMCILSFTGPGAGPKQAVDELRAAHSDNGSLEENPQGLFDDDDELLGTGEAWDLLNIMLIRNGHDDISLYRRVGLGVIHYKALRALDVNWASCRLG